jgi:ribosomal protein S18 acetylase RimI-like enzyme
MAGSADSAEPVRIVRLSPDRLDDLLPLVAAYQRYYRQRGIDEQRNRDFFAALISAPEQGVQHLAYRDGVACGYSTLYFTRCSVRARRIATLYDLFVAEAARGCGVGRRLIEHAARHAADLGYRDLEWITESDNRRAQALYDSLGAKRGAWYLYTLEL